MKIQGDDVRAVAQLWHELASSAAAEVDAALRHALAELVRLFNARNAFWVGAVRAARPEPDDPLSGWRPQALVQLQSTEEHARLAAILLRDLRAERVDPQTLAIVERAGRTRAYLRAELVDDDQWLSSTLYHDVLRPLGVEDRLIGAQTVSPTAESYIGLDRGADDPPFGARERDLLHLFLCGAYIFHRELLRSYGLIEASVPLSPREREVLLLLLAGLPEARIAAALELSVGTAHQHVAAIKRKFGVRGRQHLFALWLRQPTPTPERMADSRVHLVPLY